MDIVPFHFDAYGGFGQVKGVARIDERGLELQFNTSDALFGVLKSGRRSVRVPFGTLMSVRFRAGWLWLMPHIELRVRDLDALKDLPESDQGLVTLNLRWRDRHDGRAFAADLELLRSRHRILQLDRAIDHLAQSAAPLPSGAHATPPRGATSTPRPSQSED